MKIVELEIDKLKPYEKNAKLHTQKQIDSLAMMIRKVGMIQPVVVGYDNTIIIGHGRTAAAKQAGLTTVPVVKLDDLTKAEERSLRLFDNKIAETGFDLSLLKEEVFQLSELPDFNIELTGFDMENFTEMLPQGSAFKEQHQSEKEAEQEKADDVPETEQNQFNVQRGQVWQLGRHRLMCGDSTSEADVAKLKNGQKADMVFTDPPYGMSAVEKSAVLSARYKPIAGDDSTDVVKSVCKLILKMNIPTVLWGANYYSSVLPDAACWLVWDKNNGQSDQMDCELAWTNLKGVVRQFTQASEKINRVHPTQKPVSLVEWCWGRYDAGSNILDLFLGSGSTLIACEKTNRVCYGMELDEHYCSVIINRWQEFTGQKAQLLEG